LEELGGVHAAGGSIALDAITIAGEVYLSLNIDVDTLAAVEAQVALRVAVFDF
jgi:hypothetical protein